MSPRPYYRLDIDPKLLSDLCDVVDEEFAARVPEAEVKRIFAGHAQLIGEIVEFGFNDSSIREQVRQVMVHDLLGSGRSWPTYADGEEEAECFSRDLDAALVKRGFAASGS